MMSVNLYVPVIQTVIHAVHQLVLREQCIGHTHTDHHYQNVKYLLFLFHFLFPLPSLGTLSNTSTLFRPLHRPDSYNPRCGVWPYAVNRSSDRIWGMYTTSLSIWRGTDAQAYISRPDGTRYSKWLDIRQWTWRPVEHRTEGLPLSTVCFLQSEEEKVGQFSLNQNHDWPWLGVHNSPRCHYSTTKSSPKAWLDYRVQSGWKTDSPICPS